MKKKIILFLFTLTFLFCASQIFGWFRPEGAPASLTSVIGEAEKKELKPERIIIVGDMMFDRGVERLMEKSSFNYPVDFIYDFLSRFDMVIGNLEGPVNEKPTIFPDDSLKFSFDKRVVGTLKTAHFDLVSLANNHTLNTGEDGLEETKTILKEGDISFAGDPIGCDAEYIYQKDGITYYPVNVTYPNNCTDDEIGGTIAEIRFYNPETFIVVMPHWGTEYKTVNSTSQQELAHQMIDAGADLVVGGHPHVVQNVEEYNDKLIFYSLGNFIFDQYFSKETQEGLMLGIDVYRDKKVYNLYPVKNRVSQARLMEEDKTDFLSKLAESSSEGLKESIKQGSIIIENKHE